MKGGDFIISLFESYPRAQSIAIAGIYGINDKELSVYQINDHLHIVSRQELFVEAYDRFLAKDIRKPDYYLIGIAEDTRYCVGFREIKTIDDAESSFTLFQQAICIFYNAPHYLANIIGFPREGSGIYILSEVYSSGENKELKNDLYRYETMIHSSMLPNQPRNYNVELKIFFSQFVNSYMNIHDRRWLLTAHKFTSGINQSFVENAVLDFSVALESLFAENKDQISFKLRLFCALFIGESFKERKEIFKTLGDFYSIRSNIVHGNKAKITNEKVKIIEKTGKYLSKSIIKSCGKKIDSELFQELEFMYLLGAPRLMREKVRIVINEKELVSLICKRHNIDSHLSYRAYLFNDRTDAPDDEYQELLIDIEISEGNTETFHGSFYIPIENNSRISFWLSHNNEDGFHYLVDF